MDARGLIFSKKKTANYTYSIGRVLLFLFNKKTNSSANYWTSEGINYILDYNV